MSKTNFENARKTLSQACEHYMTHNMSQLDSLPAAPQEFSYDTMSLAGKDNYRDKPGFVGWISYLYTQLMWEILAVDKTFKENGDFFVLYYQHVYPPYKKRFFTSDDEIELNSSGYIKTEVIIDRIKSLEGFLQWIMVNPNQEKDFNLRLERYKAETNNNFVGLDSDSPSITAYKALKNLQVLIRFIATLPTYRLISYGLSARLDEIMPVLEGYIKGIAVQELRETIDSQLSDKEAVKALASQLSNNTLVEILEKNRQSRAENILKIISVVLIPVGIGIISTAILAAKRLYDSNGTSINFFKPLSHDLYHEVKSESHNAIRDLDYEYPIKFDL